MHVLDVRATLTMNKTKIRRKVENMHKVRIDRVVVLAGPCLAAIQMYSQDSSVQQGARPGIVSKPWMNSNLSPDARADLVAKELTQDEQFTLIRGFLGFAVGRLLKPQRAIGSAGFVPEFQGSASRLFRNRMTLYQPLESQRLT